MAQPLSPAQIGARTRLRREAIGRSQADIAEQLNVSQNTIQKIENGKVGRSRFLSKYWTLLGLDLTELNSAFTGFTAPPFRAENVPTPTPGPDRWDPVTIKVMSVADREAELFRAGYELGLRMARMTKAKRIDAGIIQPDNSGEFLVGLSIYREDDTQVPFSLSVTLARDLATQLPRILDHLEALKRQTTK